MKKSNYKSLQILASIYIILGVLVMGAGILEGLNIVGSTYNIQSLNYGRFNLSLLLPSIILLVTGIIIIALGELFNAIRELVLNSRITMENSYKQTEILDKIINRQQNRSTQPSNSLLSKSSDKKSG